jgi:hypothetical protein
LLSCWSASIIGFNATFMIVLLLKERSSRSQNAGDRPSSPGTLHQMMVDDALHVCSELLTVSVSPIPSMHENQYPPWRALAPVPTTVAFLAI